MQDVKVENPSLWPGSIELSAEERQRFVLGLPASWLKGRLLKGLVTWLSWFLELHSAILQDWGHGLGSEC